VDDGVAPYLGSGDLNGLRSALELLTFCRLGAGEAIAAVKRPQSTDWSGLSEGYYGASLLLRSLLATKLGCEGKKRIRLNQLMGEDSSCSL
jgi:hypothetical protein